MLKSSVTVSLILKLYDFFCKSKTYALLKAAALFCLRTLTGSVFGKIANIANIKLCRETSIFYRVIGKIFTVFFNGVKKIYEYSKSGYLYKFIHFLIKDSYIFKTENIMVIMFAVMFICPHEMWNNVYGLILAVMLLAFYVVSAVSREGFGKNFGGIWMPFIFFAVAVVFSVIISKNVSDSVRVMMFFITSFIFCTLVYGTLSSKERFDKICAGILCAMVVTGIVAIGQNVAGIEVDPSLTDVYLNKGMPGRAFSTWANPNNYAQFLVIFFPFCVAYAITRKNTKTKFVAVCALIIPLVALLLTYSRSGWLGFALSFIAFALLYNKRLFPVILVLGIAAMFFMPESVMNRIMTIGNLKDSSSAYRIDIWTGTIEMLKDFWQTGVGLGPGAFKAVYPPYGVGTSRIAPHTHMLFMEIFAEMGIIGLITFTVLIACLIIRSCKSVKNVRNTGMKAYTVAAASSMVGIMIIGFAEYVWFYPRVMFAFFIAIGMAMAAIKISDGKKIQED